MAEKLKTNSFWQSYSDLLTSLFFIILILFIVCITNLKVSNHKLEISLEQQKKILQLDEQFRELSESSDLKYIEENKIFVAKDLIGVEIFEPNKDEIKQEYIPIVDKVGHSIESILKSLKENNPQFRYQLIIEGTAAIPYQQLQTKSYNPDNKSVYILSYLRALALYNKWMKDGLDLRKYNTEILICGSGFSGINRDMDIEENNKRFVIQIIPKVGRPDSPSKAKSLN